MPICRTGSGWTHLLRRVSPGSKSPRPEFLSASAPSGHSSKNKTSSAYDRVQPHPHASSMPKICHTTPTCPNGLAPPSSVAPASYRARGSRTAAHRRAYARARRASAARCTRAGRPAPASAARRGAASTPGELSQDAKRASEAESAGGSVGGRCESGSCGAHELGRARGRGGAHAWVAVEHGDRLGEARFV
jgi:hypothetical protein